MYTRIPCLRRQESRLGRDSRLGQLESRHGSARAGLGRLAGRRPAHPDHIQSPESAPRQHCTTSYWVTKLTTKSRCQAYLGGAPLRRRAGGLLACSRRLRRRQRQLDTGVRPSSCRLPPPPPPTVLLSMCYPWTCDRLGLSRKLSSAQTFETTQRADRRPSCPLRRLHRRQPSRRLAEGDFYRQCTTAHLPPPLLPRPSTRT